MAWSMADQARGWQKALDSTDFERTSSSRKKRSTSPYSRQKVMRRPGYLRCYPSKWNTSQIRRESIYGPCNVMIKPSADKFAMSLDSSIESPLRITNQFESFQKIKLHKGRETSCHLRRWCWRSSGTDTDFTGLMSYQRAASLTLGMISLTSYRDYSKFLLLIRMT
jgi:hypothetical protein